MPSPNARGTPLSHIRRQITQVIYGRRHEVIEGIEIDFRHPKFDSEIWEAPRGLFVVCDLGPDGPKLWFPWSARTEAEDSVDDLASVTRPDDSSLKASPDYILEPGDRLYIRKVEVVSTDNELLRGCNPDRGEVYLNIHKVGIDLIEIQRPIVMRPRNELRELDFTGNYFTAIAGRIKSHFGTISLENVTDDGSFAYQALRKLAVINRFPSTETMTVKGQEITVVLPTLPDEEYHDNSNIWFTINDAVAVGYLWAKSEDERNFLSRVAKKISDKQAKAGRKGGQTRFKIREHKLEIVKAVANQFLARRETFPLQVEIIDYVDNFDRWKACGTELGLVNIHKPRRSGIESLVSELFGSKSRSAPKRGE